MQTARDGISNLGIGKGQTRLEEDIAADRDAAAASEAVSAGATPAENAPTGSAPAGAPPAPLTNGSAPPQADEAPKEFSTVKVQKAPPARRKRKPNAAPAAEPVAAEEPILAPEEGVAAEATETSPAAAEQPDTTVLPGADAPAPVAPEAAPPESAPAEAAPTPVSPAKVQRAAKKKTKDEPVAAESTETVEAVGIVPDDEPAVAVAPATETAPVAAGDPSESIQSASEESAGEPVGSEAPAESTGGAAPEPPKKSRKGAKRQAKQTVHVSKEEQLVRAFHSMHTILNSPIWNPIVTEASA